MSICLKCAESASLYNKLLYSERTFTAYMFLKRYDLGNNEAIRVIENGGGTQGGILIFASLEPARCARYCARYFALNNGNSGTL